MEVCRSPELTSHVTRMPVERLGVDAAIIFADIMLPLHSLGKEFELVKGIGPVIERPVRTPGDVQSVLTRDPVDDVSYLYDSIRRTRNDLSPSKPLIGFAGAPFTLACYLIQGKPSRTYGKVKEFMYCHPQAFHQFLEKICSVIDRYLSQQFHTGADVLQLFDSWVGILSPADYEQYIFPHVKNLFSRLPKQAPTIYFGTGSASLLNLMAETGPDCLGIDWRIELERAQKQIERDIPLMGNLDPARMLAPFNSIRPELDSILQQAEPLRGHVFNLGHGFHPDTPLENALRVTRYIKDQSKN